jgi:hypothetical protein
MKKLMCLIAAMLVAGAVVAEDHLTVEVYNRSRAELDLNVGLALFDETSLTEAMYYLPSKEHNPKKVGPGEICEAKFLKPYTPKSINPSNCKMEFSIQYGESTLDKYQYSEQFEVEEEDPALPTERNKRLTIIVPEGSDSDTVKFRIDAGRHRYI